MEAKNATFQGAIDGVKQFVIPVFQRDCKWDEDNPLRSWNDTAGASAAGPCRRFNFGGANHVG